MVLVAGVADVDVVVAGVVIVVGATGTAVGATTGAGAGTTTGAITALGVAGFMVNAGEVLVTAYCTCWSA